MKHWLHTCAAAPLKYPEQEVKASGVSEERLSIRQVGFKEAFSSDKLLEFGIYPSQALG